MQINVQQAATQTSVIQAGHLVNNEAIQMLGKKKEEKKPTIHHITHYCQDEHNLNAIRDNIGSCTNNS